MPNCPLCGSGAVEEVGPGGEGLSLECKGCGNFRINRSVYGQFVSDKSLAKKFASWVYEQNATGVTPIIGSEIISQANSITRPSTKRRAEWYLREAIRSLNGALSGAITVHDRNLRVASW
jgi:hypothetical protein